MTPFTRAALSIVIVAAVPACDGDKKLSRSKAAEHVSSMVETATADVQEIRGGLPEGAKHLAKLYEGATAPKDDLPAVREALDRAREAAGGKDVRIGGGANTIQQYLRERLIDELHLAIAPVLLGSGERLFEGVDMRALGYRCVEQVASEKATHVVLQR